MASQPKPLSTVEAIGRALGCTLSLRHSQSWASVTFRGERLLLDSAMDLPADLDVRAFNVPGFIVADATEEAPRVLGILLVEDT